MLFLLTIVGTGYAAYKFVPIYYTGYKVDEIMGDIAAQSSDLARDQSGREQRLLEQAKDRIEALGITDPRLTVAYESNYTVLSVRYVVIVSHPFGKTTVLDFERSAEVPE